MALSTADKQHRYRERLKAGRRPVHKGQKQSRKQSGTVPYPTNEG